MLTVMTFDFMRAYLARMLQELGPLTEKEIEAEVYPSFLYVTGVLYITGIPWKDMKNKIGYDPETRRFYTLEGVAP